MVSDWISLSGFILAYTTMLVMAWIIASQSLYLHHAKIGNQNDSIQKFHDALKAPARYIVRHHLRQNRKNQAVRRFVTRISRLVMALIYLSFLFGFIVQVVIYWQMNQVINSVLMLLITSLSLWHFIAAWQFGKRMMQFQKQKSAN